MNLNLCFVFFEFALRNFLNLNLCFVFFSSGGVRGPGLGDQACWPRGVITLGVFQDPHHHLKEVNNNRSFAKATAIFRKSLFTPIGDDYLPQNRDLYTGDRFTIGMYCIAETFSVNDNWFNQSDANRQLDLPWKGATYFYLKAPLYDAGCNLNPHGN